jgi:rod shape-determining protein MreD
VILFIGIVIDKLSGGPFGIYLTIYLWLFIFVRWTKTFLHAGSAIILPFVFVLSVLIQNIAFLGVNALLIPASKIPGNAVGKVLKEILWAMCTGPLFILFLNYFHNKWDRLWNKVFLKLLRG